jgi:hypothetical protein
VRPDDRPLRRAAKVSDAESPVSLMSAIPGVRHQLGRLGQSSAVRPDDRPLRRAAKVSDTESPVSLIAAIPGVRHQLGRLGERA